MCILALSSIKCLLSWLEIWTLFSENNFQLIVYPNVLLGYGEGEVAKDGQKETAETQEDKPEEQKEETKEETKEESKPETEAEKEPEAEAGSAEEYKEERSQEEEKAEEEKEKTEEKKEEEAEPPKEETEGDVKLFIFLSLTSLLAVMHSKCLLFRFTSFVEVFAIFV